ncbi:PDC sensor domain-containing protein [Shewanella nanhaiensis]|uniref:histidine kinase n=1 Tax=Shewanella nanhaiensis TaxID=2864872 RepID=A0ABS7E2S9_9GAMM|nr:PAS domain-containing protein [Shewanella nanhaiensis]MBW8183904.1 PAS domain-containing protein [Shewanella nanhaiensis]
MGNSSPTHSPIKVLRWRDSLPIKFSFIQFIIASLIIISSVWLIFTIEKSHHLETQIVLSQNQGLAFVATLEQTTTKIESLASSIASLGQIYSNNTQVLQDSIPALLNTDGKHQLISGGGLWPEPVAFSHDKQRDSFFWSRNKDLELQQIEGYNSQIGPDYHEESWYKPIRFYPQNTALWSQAYIDTYTKETMLTASVPMWSEHQFLGVATIDITLSGLAHFFNEAVNEKTENKGYIFALDHLNKVIAFPDEHLSPQLIEPNSLFKPLSQLAKHKQNLAIINQKLLEVDEELIQRAQQHPVFSQKQLSSLLQSTPVDQRDKLAALINLNASKTLNTAELIASFKLSPNEQNNQASLVSIFLMPSTYWKIILVTPLDSINEEANNIAARIGFYLVVMQFFGLLLLFILQHRLFIRPISSMVFALKENQVAKLELEAAKRKDEVGQLAQAFVFRNHQLEVAFASLDASNLALEEQLAVQQLAQNELKLRKTQLNSLLNASHNLIFIKDLQGSYTLVNDRFCEVIGIERHAILGKKDLQLFPPHIAELILKHDRVTLDAQEPQSFEQAFPSSHGETLYQITKFPIVNDEGETISMGNMAFDISSQKVITQELHDNNLQLTNELSELSLQIKQAQQRITQQKEVINQIEHENLGAQQQRHMDSNVYLLFPAMFSALIKRQMIEQDHLVAQMCQNQQEAETKLDTMLALLTHNTDTLRHFQQILLSKNEAVKAINLSQFLSHFLAVFETKLIEENINLELECDENIIVNLPSWDLLLLLYSIVNNSLNHAFIDKRSGCNIVIRATQESETIIITVEDNGIGVSPEKLTQLNEQLLSSNSQRSLSRLNGWLKAQFSGQIILEAKSNQYMRTICHFAKKP